MHQYTQTQSDITLTSFSFSSSFPLPQSYPKSWCPSQFSPHCLSPPRPPAPRLSTDPQWLDFSELCRRSWWTWQRTWLQKTGLIFGWVREGRRCCDCWRWDRQPFRFRWDRFHTCLVLSSALPFPLWSAPGSALVLDRWGWLQVHQDQHPHWHYHNSHYCDYFPVVIDDQTLFPGVGVRGIVGSWLVFFYPIRSRECTVAAVVEYQSPTLWNAFLCSSSLTVSHLHLLFDLFCGLTSSISFLSIFPWEILVCPSTHFLVARVRFRFIELL